MNMDFMNEPSCKPPISAIRSSPLFSSIPPFCWFYCYDIIINHMFPYYFLFKQLVNQITLLCYHYIPHIFSQYPLKSIVTITKDSCCDCPMLSHVNSWNIFPIYIYIYTLLIYVYIYMYMGYVLTFHDVAMYSDGLLPARLASCGGPSTKLRRLT